MDAQEQGDGGAVRERLTVIRSSNRRRWTSWRKSSVRRALDRELADDFIIMPGGRPRPSKAWDDQARRPELCIWWGSMAFRLDEAIDAGYDPRRIVRPLLRLVRHVLARCAERDARRSGPTNAAA